MRREEAVDLARVLVDGFPGVYYRDANGTVAVFAARMLGWDARTAAKAVDRLIDGSRAFPSVVDLRDAYRASGGTLPDPGRNMSPAVDNPERPMTAGEAAVVREQRRQARAAVLRSGQDDLEGGP